MSSLIRAHARFSLVLVALFAGAFLASFASAQSVTTIAGGLVGDGSIPTDAALNHPAEVIFDASGNLYIADTYNHRVRKVTPGGQVSTYAGTGNSGSSGDGGQATAAKLDAPYGLAFDGAGNLYVSELRGNRIRKITSGGVISTYAGDGTPAVLNAPLHLAAAADGTLYVSETGSHRVRKIVGGVVSPFAGDGTAGSTGDSGPATSAKLSSPSGLIVQPDGSVLIADTSNSKIRRVDTSGTISTWRSMSYPYEFAYNADGILYVASDYGIFWDSGTVFQQIAGSESPWGFDGESGAGADAMFQFPHGLAVASDGRKFISDMHNNRIRVYNPAGTITTFVGPGKPTEGGAALGARVANPGGLAYDSAGNLFVSERNLYRVRKITPGGVVSTYAGSGTMGDFDAVGDGGSPMSANLFEPRGIAFTSAGDMLIAEYWRNAVRKISAAGQVSTLYTGNDIQLADQVAIDPVGNILVSHRRGISQIPAAGGAAVVIVGNGQSSGLYPENVAATATPANRVGQMGFDAAGNLYYADTYFHTVRKVSGGLVTTVAGVGGVSGDDGDGGPATAAHLKVPHSLYVEADGSFIVGDGNGRFRRVSNGVIQSYAGTSVPGFNGDGVLSATQFGVLATLVRAPDGSLVIGDEYNGRVRKMPLSTGPASPSISIADVSVAEGNSGTKILTFTVSLGVAATSTVTFNLATANGSATAGSDYVALALNGQTIASGQSSKTFSVTINGDATVESDETFTLSVSNVSGATVTDGSATGTITNDDAGGGGPTLSIADVSIAEGNASTKLATFTVTLSAAQTGPVFFDIATVNGTATAGSDYVAKTTAGVRIAAGATSKTFTVTINGDTAVEPDEAFTVNLSNGVGASIADGQGVGTITNDDSGGGGTPSLSIADVSIVEGDWGANFPLTFRVSLSGPASGPVTFDIATANGSATAGEDYVAIALSNQSIPAGETSRTFNVTVTGDYFFEPNETFAVNVTNVLGATVSDGSATGTITNNDITPSIRIEDGGVDEGDTGAQWASFSIIVEGTNPNPTTFDVTTSDGSAVAGSDYTPVTTHHEIPAGSSGAFSVHVDVLGDRLFEADETFSVTLSNVTGGAVVTDAQATGLIVNDDPDLSDAPWLSINDVAVTEGNSGYTTATFTVSLSKPLTENMYFGLNLDGVTATMYEDFELNGLNGWMGPGESSRTFEVQVKGDYKFEPDETFTVTAVNVDGANVADAVGVGTILNDDPVPPTMSVGDATVSEGNSGLKTMTFPVTLSTPAPSQVCFFIEIIGGTATAGLDYEDAAAQPCIQAGQSGFNFNVSIIGDTANEPDETVLVSTTMLSESAELVDGTATGTITNDDAGGLPSLSIGDVTIVEGNSGSSFATFTVTLSAPAAADVTFNASTSDGSATVANGDYVAQNWGLVFQPGSTLLSLQVPITGDPNFEADEYFTINLSNVVGASVDDGSAIGFITNDDVASGPTMSITNQVISYEGNSGTAQAVFTLQLSAPASTAVTYDIATINNTATAPSDFVATSLVGQTIPAGQTSKTFSVTINGDTEVEFDEVYVVEVTNVIGAQMPNNQSIAKIRNDDGVPALSISDVSISEGNSGTKMANFTLSLSAPSSTWVQVDVNTVDGSATVGSDYYQQSPQGFGISPGQTSATLGVEIIGDTTSEPNETFTVNLSNVVNATIADGQGTGTITNDDGGGAPTLSIADVSIAEGNSGTKLATFTVSLSAAQTGPVFFDIATANGTATAGSDYVAKTTAGVRIAAGATSKTFTVTINGDTTSESDENFVVNVTNPVGATIADGSATGTITNDDAVASPTLSIADASVSEGNSGTKTLTFTVSLSPAAAGTVSYDIATANGTATSGSDYVASTLVGQTISAGGTSKTFVVTINGDTGTEANETFTVTLTNVSGATLGDGSAVGTITNDDGGGTGPTLSIGDVTLAEGNGLSKQMTFTVTLSAAATGPVKYNIATANGTAIAPGDYTTKSLTGQSIAAGATSKVFTVAIKGDTVVEPNETFTVNVTSVTGATLGDGQATGTISNDDAATITVARFDARGLVDDLDDGNRQPVISTSEYATLLLDTAKGICSRTNAATVVGIDGAENLSVLKDLADATNATCANSRYQAVLGEGSGYLVEATSDTDARGVQVIAQPTHDAKTKLTSLQVLGSGHAGPITVLLPQALSATPAERTTQLRMLGQHVNAMLKADAEARLVLIGGVTVPGLLDLTARSLPAKSALPGERVLASPALLQEFTKSKVEFVTPAANEAPSQLLQLQR